MIITDRKAHRNGIKKPKQHRHESTLGVSWTLFQFSVEIAYSIHMSV